MKQVQSLFIKNVAQIVTRPGAQAAHGRDAMRNIGVIEGPAAVLVKDGVIAAVGSMAEATAWDTSGYPEWDAAGCTLLPGFVDSHTHLVFGGYREEEFQWRLAGDSYMSIMERGGGIANTMKATRTTSAEELEQRASEHLQTMLSMGVTTVEAKSGYGMELDTELKQMRVVRRLQQSQPIDLVSTFMAAHDTPPEYKGNPSAFIEHIVADMLPCVAEEGLAEFCDIFTEKGVFDHEQTRRLLIAAKEHGLKVKMHADEIVPFGGAELAAELGCHSADHLLQISEEGIRALAGSKTVGTLLPCTAFSLKADYAPARKMIDAGCAVAVASDLNPGSCFSNSIPLMFALATIYMGMSVEEAITALTLNGAAAIGRADKIGSIEVGKQADFAVLRFPSYRFLSYHFGVNLVTATIKRGVVYRNQIVQQ